MTTSKATSSTVATVASKVLQNNSTGKNSKTAAASALAQTGNEKTTSAAAATAASKVLRDGRTSAESKTAAASALAQAKSKK